MTYEQLLSTKGKKYQRVSNALALYASQRIKQGLFIDASEFYRLYRTLVKTI